MAAKTVTVKVARRADDGTFTTKKSADQHPHTTVVETIKRTIKGK